MADHEWLPALQVWTRQKQQCFDPIKLRNPALSRQLQLPKGTVVTSLQDAAQPSCPICMSALDQDGRRKALVVSCLHEFCTTCLDLWAERSRACPLCKGHMQGYLHIYAEGLRALPPGNASGVARSVPHPQRLEEWIDRELAAILGTADVALVRMHVLGLLAADRQASTQRHQFQRLPGSMGDFNREQGLGQECPPRRRCSPSFMTAQRRSGMSSGHSATPPSL
ncbi:hypothetical protein WJX73_002755 [Symbiochloris irregularis]|uniref:RING-type E3 ubiquitin transferase n=1 Tax=Symbiochloris irregularis TaxID=706552 RepID=A0AAW1NQF0_9CHLO